MNFDNGASEFKQIRRQILQSPAADPSCPLLGLIHINFCCTILWSRPGSNEEGRDGPRPDTRPLLNPRRMRRLMTDLQAKRWSCRHPSHLRWATSRRALRSSSSLQRKGATRGGKGHDVDAHQLRPRLRLTGHGIPGRTGSDGAAGGDGAAAPFKHAKVMSGSPVPAGQPPMPVRANLG